MIIYFSNFKLLQKLQNKEITMTIRGESFPGINKIRIGDTVAIYFKYGDYFKRIGYAVITNIEFKKIKELTEEHAKRCGYDSLEQLKKALRRYLRFYYREDKRVSIIEFSWKK